MTSSARRIVERLRIIGLNLQSLIVVLNGTHIIALVLIGEAAIVESQRIFRIDADGFAIVLDGAIILRPVVIGITADCA